MQKIHCLVCQNRPESHELSKKIGTTHSQLLISLTNISLRIHTYCPTSATLSQKTFCLQSFDPKKIQFLFFFVKNILLSSLYRFHCAHDRARAIRKITESGKQLVSDNACVQASDLPKNCNLAFYLAGTAGGWKFDEEKVPWLPLGLKPFRTKATATTNVSEPKKKRQRKRSSHKAGGTTARASTQTAQAHVRTPLGGHWDRRRCDFRPWFPPLELAADWRDAATLMLYIWSIVIFH